MVLRAVEQLAEAGPRHHVVDGVEPEVGQLGHLLLELVGRGDEQLAEGPGVDEAQLAALGEGDHHVGVLGHRVLGALARSSWPLMPRWTTRTSPLVERAPAGTCPGARRR